MDFKIDRAFTEQMKDYGIDQSVGAYGEHRLQMGEGKTIRLDKLSSEVTFQGFTKDTKISRGLEGLDRSTQDTLNILAGPGKLDVKALLTSLKTSADYTSRLIDLEHLFADRGKNSMWAYAEAVQTLSSKDLSVVYQSLVSAEMSLLTSALEYEADRYPETAADAKDARGRLFDIQALVLREMGNRVTNGEIDEAIAKLPKTAEEAAAREVVLAEKKTRLESLKTQIDALRDAYTREMRPCFEISNQLDAQKADLAEIEQAYNAAKALFSSQSDAYAALVSSTVEARNQCAAEDVATQQELAQTLARAKAEYDAQKDVLVQAAEMLRFAQESVATLKDEIAAFDPIKEDFDTKMDALSPELRALQHEVEILSATEASLNASRPQSLMAQYTRKREEIALATNETDFRPATLLTLTEVAASSATQREKQNEEHIEEFSNHGISATPHEMGDVLRETPLTINYKTSRFLYDTSILKNPDKRMPNTFDFTKMSESYKALRNTVELNFFPELGGHEVRPEERPVYGSLNSSKNVAGPSGAREYGNSVIILKKEVAKRATYSIDDSFYGIPLKITPERRENFYKLLGTSGLPDDVVASLLDPNSTSHASCEEYLDWLSGLNAPRTRTIHSSLNDIKLGHPTTPEERDLLGSMFIKVFASSENTRSNTATYDNIESLLQGLDLTGAMLADAVERKQRGEDSSTILCGAYMEAQIHGPIIPERDIEEIRVFLDDLIDPLKTKEEKRAKLEEISAAMNEFRARTGVKFVYFSSDTKTAPLLSEQMRKDFIDNANWVDEDDSRVDQIQKEGLAFFVDHTHSDVKAILDDLTSNLQASLQHIITDNDLSRYFPAELEIAPVNSTLYNKILANIQQDYNQMVRSRNPNDYTTPRAVAKALFKHAVERILFDKAALLQKLEDMGLTEAQFISLQSWVIHSTVTKEDEFDLAIRAARIQEYTLFQLVSKNPPLSSKEMLHVLAQAANEVKPLVTAFLKKNGQKEIGPDDIATYINRGLFLGLRLARNADDRVSNEDLRFLHERLNSQTLLSLRAQLSRVTEELSQNEEFPLATHPGIYLLSNVSFSLNAIAENIAKAIGEKATKPSFKLPLSTISKSTRDLFHSFTENAVDGSDELGLKHLFGDQPAKEVCIMDFFDRLFPGYASFPAAQHPNSLAQTHAQRRSFLIHHLDTYLEHERSFDSRVAVHGRGHITRAFIFASAMCSILEENGVEIDRNAVLCGISGHDSGREGNGYDRWEKQSAQKTVAMMQADYGADSLGDDYKQGIVSILSNPADNTLEGMVLKGADSLDIGRTTELDINRMKFLRPRKDETLPSNIQTLREKLATEADLLQRLTNAYCAQKDYLRQLEIEQMSENGAAAEVAHQKHEQTMRLVEASFRSERAIPAEQFVANMEDVISSNPQLFPLLSKYYK